jgi:recombination protein RecT
MAALVPLGGYKNKIEKMQDLIEKHSVDIQKLVPLHVDSGRMIRVARAAMTRKPELTECTEISLIAAIVEAAVLGLKLETRMNHCWLAGFKNNRTGLRDAQLLMGYEGYIDLAHRSRMLDSIYAECVYKNDEFKEHLGTNKRIEHDYDPDKDRGPIIGVYAVAYLRGSSRPIHEYLPKARIMKLKARGGGGPAWSDPDFGEPGMFRAKAIKQLQRWLPKSDEMARAASLDTTAEIGESQDFQFTERINGDAGVVEAKVIDRKADAIRAKVVEVKRRNGNEKPKAKPEPEPELVGEESDPEQNDEVGFTPFLQLEGLAIGGVTRTSAQCQSCEKKRIQKLDKDVYKVTVSNSGSRTMTWWHQHLPDCCVPGKQLMLTVKREKDWGPRPQFTIEGMQEDIDATN